MKELLGNETNVRSHKQAVHEKQHGHWLESMGNNIGKVGREHIKNTKS